MGEQHLFLAAECVALQTTIFATSTSHLFDLAVCVCKRGDLTPHFDVSQRFSMAVSFPHASIQLYTAIYSRIQLYTVGKHLPSQNRYAMLYHKNGHCLAPAPVPVPRTMAALSGYDRPVGAPDVDKTLTRNRMAGIAGESRAGDEDFMHGQ